MEKLLRIAIVTDIHHGPDRYSKKGDEALALLERFVHRANEMSVDLVVDLGDRISNADPAADRINLQAVAATFGKLDAECVHLPGNHDVVHLSISEQEELLGGSLRHQSMDLAGHHLLFWKPSCRLIEGVGFRAGKDDLEWLENDLSGTKLPTVIFSHMPVHAVSTTGNYYFAKRYATGEQLRNAEAAREIIEKSEKAIAVVSGHVHWNQLHFMDGIPHLSIQSISETYTTHPHPTGAWACLTVDNTIEVEIFGKEPMLFRLPIKELSRHWLPPLE